MSKVELSEEQSEVLAETLEWVLSEASAEIASTELMSFRECLKDNRDILREVLSQIEREPVAQK